MLSGEHCLHITAAIPVRTAPRRYCSGRDTCHYSCLATVATVHHVLMQHMLAGIYSQQQNVTAFVIRIDVEHLDIKMPQFN